MPVTTEETSLSPLQMYVDVSPGGQTDSVTAVRWCVGPDLIERLRDLNITDAKVLFVTLHGKQEVGRKMVPLTAEMTYISFTRPGANEVKAVVVYNDPTHLMRQERKGSYLYNVSFDGRVSDSFSMCSRLPGEDSITVNVPAEMFAKKPNRAVVKVAGVIFSNPKDQCDLRRQFLLSLPLLPLITIFFIVVGALSIALSAVVFVLFAFFGLRGNGLISIRHPLSEGPFANMESVRVERFSSVWIHEPGAHPSDHLKHPVWWVLNPVTISLFIGAGFASNAIWDLHLSALRTLLLAMVVPTALAVLAIAVGGVGLRWYNGNADKRKEAEKQRIAKENAEFFRALEALACNGPRDPSLGALPRSKRTVTLRFQALKSKVCRPYAK